MGCGAGRYHLNEEMSQCSDTNGAASVGENSDSRRDESGTQTIQKDDQLHLPTSTHEDGPQKDISFSSEGCPETEELMANRRMKRSHSMCSMSSQMSLSRVAAGHGGVSILRYVDKDDVDPSSPKCVIKVYDEREVTVYKELAETGDRLQAFAAQFYGEVDEEDMPEDLQGSRYMKLTNLLRKFGTDPHVMDCKLGTRSFVEDEARSKKLRTDLYFKMHAIDASAPTEEENEAQACTKYRWMSFNDSITTTTQFGFRIDGISNSEGSVPKRTLKDLRNIADMSKCIVDHLFHGHDRAHVSIAAAAVLKTLREIKDAFEASSFAKRHSFVGMSLLFIVEQGGPSAGVYLIDFAKTLPLPEGVSINHKSAWEPGNHEDGFLIGIDNLILSWEQVLSQLSGQTGSYKTPSCCHRLAAPCPARPPSHQSA